MTALADEARDGLLLELTGVARRLAGVEEIRRGRVAAHRSLGQAGHPVMHTLKLTEQREGACTLDNVSMLSLNLLPESSTD